MTDETKHQPRNLSVADLCERFGVSDTTIWRWRKQGTFPEPFILPGGRLRWTGKAIDEWEADLHERNTAA
jgi:prophage regulatory protein